MPANDYYDHGSFPSPGAPGASASLRAEFELIETGFNKMPTITGNAGKFVRVNVLGTALEPVTSITGVTFDGVIGGTTPAAGTFTTLTSTGAATLNSLGVTGNVSAGGTLAITGTSAFTGNVTMAGSLAVSGTLSGPSMDLKANAANAVLTGVPIAPTAALGTNTTQIATMAAIYNQVLAATVPVTPSDAGKFLYTPDGATYTWGEVYPSQTGNSGKFLSTNGTTTSWTASGVTNVTSSATSITLTSTSTLAVITPTSYGVTVKLQDATSDTPKDSYHAIANKGAYPVRVTDSADTLLGFVYPGVKTNVGLVTASAAGVWAFDNVERVGAAALLLTTNLVFVDQVIDLGSSRELLVGRGASSANCYAVVYNRSTGAFGSVTLVRTATFGAGLIAACLSATDQVLVASCPTGAATFEAVVLSISGATITVNAVGAGGAVTLSANMQNFGDGCGLIPVGSSFVAAYTGAGGVAGQVRAITISGTSPTVGAAGTHTGAGSLQVAIGSVVVTSSCNGSNVYVKPYTVSGSTVSAGTEASFTSATLAFFALTGSGRILAIGATQAAIATLTGTVITVSAVANPLSSPVTDAIIVSSSKILVINNQSSANANVVTDTAGVASKGTAITISNNSTRAALYVSGTNVVVGEVQAFHMVDCSGASPVKTSSFRLGGVSGSPPISGVSNAVLSRTADAVFASEYAESINYTALQTVRFYSGVPSLLPVRGPLTGTTTMVNYRGRNDAERWAADGASVIYKMECAQ